MRATTTCMTAAALAVLACGVLADEPEVVARVKVHNSAAEAMTDVVVCGALPLPRDYDRPVDGLTLRDGEALLPTQVSVFATYPGSSAAHPVGRPEVVQLAARVTLPPAGFKALDVVAPPSAEPTKAAAPGRAIADWLAGEAPLLVEATDVFGNRYRAAPVARAALVETRQSGPVLAERVYQCVLAPAGAPAAEKPALRRFLRVRAYLTTYAGEDFATLALMIHNGPIDRPNGTVCYRGIRAGVAGPLGVRIWRKDYSSAADGKPTQDKRRTWLPCPSKRADGKVFAMAHGSAAVLRMTVFAPAAKRRAVAFARHRPIFVPVPGDDRFSWSNPATARYDAPKYPMPLRLSAGAAERAERAVKARFANGRLGWDLVYLKDRPKAARRAFGHAMPAGVAYGGMTGGGGIHYVYGVRAALTGHNGLIWMHVLLADRNFDRQRAHLFYDDGRPYTHARHVIAEGARKVLDLPYNHRGFPALRIADPACKVHADHVKAEGLLADDAARLLKYMNHDDQHLARVFDAVPAAYLACDPVSRDRLVTLGAQACRKRNIYPIRGRRNFGGWSSLFAAGRHVDAHPHAGVGMGRADGWVMHSLGWAFALSRDERIRADCVAVAREDARIRAKAQMPAGNVTLRPPFSKALKGEYFFVTPWEEGAIMADGGRSVIHILDEPRNAPQAEALRKVYARVGRWLATTAWNDDAGAPAFQLGVRKKGRAELLDRPVPEGGSAFYMGTPFAWYYELTGEKLFLDRLREMAGRDTLAGRAEKNLGNWSYALYLAQGGKAPRRGQQ